VSETHCISRDWSSGPTSVVVVVVVTVTDCICVGVGGNSPGSVCAGTGVALIVPL
jgi:hypothetical protein